KVRYDDRMPQRREPARRRPAPNFESAFGAQKAAASLLVLFIPSRDRSDQPIDQQYWTDEALKTLGRKAVSKHGATEDHPPAGRVARRRGRRGVTRGRRRSIWGGPTDRPRRHATPEPQARPRPPPGPAE